jgi:hypothetical protein
MILPHRWRRLVSWIIVLTATLATSPSLGQERVQEEPWHAWRMLLGNWEGGDGSTEQGRGTFSFSPDLQGTILVRKSHGDYPATAGRPAFSHDDLTIVYQVQDGGYRAIYFDNEHHVIRYSVEFSADSTRLTFLSDTTAPGPAFRLTYRAAGADSLHITFAIATPDSPRHFAPYREGEAHRKR